ncbi:hypothetical protein [Bacteroides pyogenes]|uniref:hypothetical protein n=1 Tax=Bacteroides pyogenes TaxID=310300 RepID=UPI002FDA153B
MKYSEKEKDYVLKSYHHGIRQFHDFEIEPILIADGYLERRGLNTYITDKGRAFYLNGGYVGAKKKERSKVIRDSVRSIIATVIGSILIILIEHLLPLLK